MLLIGVLPPVRWVSAEVVNPCFFLGGYGTESHGHLIGHAHRPEPTPLPVVETEAAA
jgi:hypothetical protein